MSGIFGAWRWGGAISNCEIEPMRAAMQIWGEHDAPVLIRRGVAFGCRVTGTVSSGAGQPYGLIELPEVLVIADARLHERAKLGRALGVNCAGVSDAELIVRAYLRWGERCAERFFGEYAIAIWDGRASTLLLARDHIGTRPLHCWHGRGEFVFASSIEAVLAFGGVPRRPDEEAVVAMLVRDSGLLLRRTPFAEVLKVAPGETIVVDGPSQRRRVHWSPHPRERLKLASPVQYAEALRECLERAVADAVETGDRVGAHVSGGLDSSAVAVLAQHALQRRGGSLAGAYSWSPPGSAIESGDERRRVHAVVAGLGIPLSYSEVRPEDVEDSARRLAALELQNSLLAEQVVLRAAAARGERVMLSGWGGDEFASFNGRGQMSSLLLTGRWLAMMREAAALARRGGASGRRLVRSSGGQVWARAVTPLIPDPLLNALGGGDARLERELVLRSGLDWTDVHPAARGLWLHARRRPAVTSARAAQLSLLRRGHLTVRIEAWALSGARHRIEHRYPLLDRRVIELCLSFPGELWLRSGWTRWVFRAAVADLLPASIVWANPKDEPAFEAATREILSGAEPSLTSAWPEVNAILAAHHRIHQSLLEISSAH